MRSCGRALRTCHTHPTPSVTVCHIIEISTFEHTLSSLPFVLVTTLSLRARGQDPRTRSLIKTRRVWFRRIPVSPKTTVRRDRLFETLTPRGK